MTSRSPLPTPVSRWLEDLKRQGKSHHTIAAYQRALVHFTHWNAEQFQDEFNPNKFIPRDIRDWQSYQRKTEKASPNTINQRLVALSRFFAWAVQQGMSQINPTSDIRGIKVANRQPKALSERDLRRLLRAVHGSGNTRDIAIIEVLVGTGVRVGELLDLRIGNILLRERSGMLTVREGKHESFREIPLTREVRAALHAYLDTHPHPDRPEASLWFSGHGPLTHRSGILRILQKYAVLAGIENEVSPHILRHTFATRYLNANRDDLRGLAALLGHTSLDTVMLYTEPALSDLAERMERVDSGSELSV